MRNLITHIRQSLSWKLSLGILLMAIPIFILSIGFLFFHSRDKVKKEATKHAAKFRLYIKIKTNCFTGQKC